MENDVKAHAAVREALQRRTRKTATTAFYRIPEDGQMFYRLGKTYPPGSVVEIPIDEGPSVTWEAIEDAKPQPAASPKAQRLPRPSDIT